VKGAPLYFVGVKIVQRYAMIPFIGEGVVFIAPQLKPQVFNLRSLNFALF
jgi:hypothetical protein